jgi:hypothetical protein
MKARNAGQRQRASKRTVGSCQPDLSGLLCISVNCCYSTALSDRGRLASRCCSSMCLNW